MLHDYRARRKKERIKVVLPFATARHNIEQLGARVVTFRTALMVGCLEKMVIFLAGLVLISAYHAR